MINKQSNPKFLGAEYMKCPKCGSEMVEGVLAVRCATCPRCGYMETEVRGGARGPSLLEGLLLAACITSLGIIAAVGISSLLKILLKEGVGSDISRKASNERTATKVFARPYKRYSN